MYAETHRFHNRFTSTLQWLSAGMGGLQLAALGGAETGLPWTPFGNVFHVFILLCAVAAWWLVARIGLDLRISPKGWEVRYSPYHWRYRHIGWEEIRHARLLKPDEAPEGAHYGFPSRDFTRTYLLTNRQHAILRLDLVTGAQLFLSTVNPEALLDFLQSGLRQPESKVKVAS